MIVTKNAYFVDLGKTGTSFVEDVIQKSCDSSFRSAKGIRHKGFEELPSDEWLKDNLVFTSVRNPLTYYVSHLTFSRKTKGPIWKGLIAQGYKDGDYPTNVEGYVSSMMIDRLDLPVSNHNNPERDAWRNMPDDLGMMTMQYVLLLDRKFLLERKRTVQEIEDWYEKYWFNSNRPNLKTIGVNNLTLETVELIENNPQYFPINDGTMDILEEVRCDKISKNKHKIQNIKYADWHTEKSIDIITHYDRILFKHLGFRYELS
jgi:hypothetical protein